MPFIASVDRFEIVREDSTVTFVNLGFLTHRIGENELLIEKKKKWVNLLFRLFFSFFFFK